jgi:Fe-S oxidoreductase
VADTPWKMRMDFLTCVECKRCTEQCPAWNAGLELDPRAFILQGRAALGHDEAPVVGTVISETALGQCTTCGACEHICPVGIEHLQVLIGAKRSQALATGKGMVATEFLQTVERHGNPFSEPQGRRQALIDELGIPRFEPGRTEYLLWLGCVWNYNQGSESSLRSMVEVLERAGVSYGVLADESCSGHHSRRQGEEMQFQTLANENLDRFQENKVTKMVTGCPHCFHTIQREYPPLREGFQVEMVHHSELLADLVRSGRLTLDGGPRGRKLTFHDPCYLTRWEDVQTAPRQVIAAAGFDVAELKRNRERTYCCGGGAAGFTLHAVDESKRIDQERKREIKASGADLLITACPECKMMLDATVEETMDLVELVARSSRPEAAPGAPGTSLPT